MNLYLNSVKPEINLNPSSLIKINGPLFLPSPLWYMYLFNNEQFPYIEQAERLPVDHNLCGMKIASEMFSDIEVVGCLSGNTFSKLEKKISNKGTTPVVFIKNFKLKLQLPNFCTYYS